MPADLAPWLVLWLAVAIGIVVRHAHEGRHVGLLLSYVASFAALHWFAPALYLLPWSASPNLDATAEGLKYSTVAVLALFLGAEAGGRWTRADLENQETGLTSRKVSSSLVNLYLASGTGLYVALFTVAGRLPTARAIVSTGSTLMVVGVALKCWNAWQDRRRRELALWLGAAAAFPVLTVIVQGFLGYGFAALVIVCGFVASFRRPGWASLFVLVVVGYVGLSVYATYMRDRDAIRSAVWSGADTSDRLERMSTIVSSFEWFDWTRRDHIDRVNMRLNQNWLVGEAVQYIGEGRAEFARGATLWEAVLSLVPRAVWPNKPVAAGSGDLVTRYTGLRFGENTSVGIGHVLEHYVNFGVPGLLIGFFVIGSLLALVDGHAAGYLSRGESDGFLLWYLPGLSLLQVGGSLTELTAMAAASWVVALAFSRIARLLPHQLPLADARGVAS